MSFEEINENKEDKSRKAIWSESKTVKNFEIDEDDGSFNIKIEQNIKHEVYSKYSNELEKSSKIIQLYEFSGNFKDVNSVEIWKPDEDPEFQEQEVSYMSVYAPISIILNTENYRELFYLKLNSTSDTWRCEKENIESI